MAELSKEELWKIYELLPSELKEVIFSQQTADNISLACNMAGLDDEKVPEVARRTGDVLMGLLAPENFKEALEKELDLEEKQARVIAHQIQRLVFNPVKESLAILYTPEKELEEIKEEKIEKEKPKRKDIYREPIEET
jgi:hypothetical protein